MPHNLKAEVFIIEDDLAICDALEWLFKSVQLATKTFHHGKAFLEAYNTNLKGCILLDIRMPYMSGLELQEQLNARQNQLPIIFMTGHGDVSLAVRAMKAGALDFLTKPFDNQYLLDQIYKAIDKNAQSQNNLESDNFVNQYGKLTPRELEVLSLIVNGKLNKQIADLLNLSKSTIEMHRANIMNKLAVKSIVDLIKLYTINLNRITQINHA